jgi:hypothetical protein
MSDLKLPLALAPYRRLIESLLPKPCCCCPQKPMVAYSHGDGGGSGPITALRLSTPPGDCTNDAATVAATGVVALIGLKLVAGRVPNERLRVEMLAGVDRALNQLIDDYCGTPPHPHWLGSQADTVTLIGRLGVVAQGYPDAAMRDGILEVAARIAVVAASAGPLGKDA